jgi:hypothetical protein
MAAIILPVISEKSLDPGFNFILSSLTNPEIERAEFQRRDLPKKLIKS